MIRTCADSSLLISPLAMALLLGIVSGAAFGADGPATTPASSDGSVSPEQYDIDRDGRLNRGEAAAYFRAREARKITINADTNKDGRISREEFETYDRKFEEELETRILDNLSTYDRQQAAQQPMTVREIRQDFAPIPPQPPEKGEEPKVQILLRSKMEDLDVAFDKATPSNFAYAHNFENQADSWSAKGVGAIRFQESGEQIYSLTASVAFDRLTNNKDASKETNSLIPRVQGALTVPGDPSFIQLHQFRLAAAYGTDFDLESKVPAAEFDYEPTIFGLAVGVAHPLANVVDYRWRVIAHGEFGRVVDAGGKPDLLKIEDSEFLRVGPKLQLELWPSHAALSRLSFTLGYTHLNDVLNDCDSSDLFTALAKWQLDDKGNYFLTLDYRHGDTPLVQEKTNVFTLGVGVRF